MSGEGLLVILLVGLVAGWLAGLIVRGFGFGLVANIGIGMGSMRTAEVAANIEIEETFIPMETGREESSIIRILLKDVTYQVSVAKSSDSSTPVAKIMRIRGK